MTEENSFDLSGLITHLQNEYNKLKTVEQGLNFVKQLQAATLQYPKIMSKMDGLKDTFSKLKTSVENLTLVNDSLAAQNAVLAKEASTAADEILARARVQVDKILSQAEQNAKATIDSADQQFNFIKRQAEQCMDQMNSDLAAKRAELERIEGVINEHKEALAQFVGK